MSITNVKKRIQGRMKKADYLAVSVIYGTYISAVAIALTFRKLKNSILSYPWPDLTAIKFNK